MNAREFLRDYITRNGPIPFSEFMQRALYQPGIGYYAHTRNPFGARGDFITAPEISPLFARCLARAIKPVLSSLPHASILELGAGSGRLAANLLDALAEDSCLPEHYDILEVSGSLRAQQQHTLQDRLTRPPQGVRWLDRLPSQPFVGVILANEVLDAMPVTRFHLQRGEVEEYYVTQEGGEFAWRLMPAAAPLSTILANWHITALSDYTSEINLALPAFLQSLSDCLARGVMLFIDYGFPRHEYYHPTRRDGTLMCHHQHRAHSNPLVHVGEQDITAHVDFTYLAESALAANCRVIGYTTQAYFLLENGITDNLAGDQVTQFQQKQAIKTLTLPHEMGELFKVMAITKEFAEPLTGFQTYDLRHKLG